jgi:hypothetical protein
MAKTVGTKAPWFLLLGTGALISVLWTAFLAWLLLQAFGYVVKFGFNQADAIIAGLREPCLASMRPSFQGETIDIVALPRSPAALAPTIVQVRQHRAV